MQVSKVPGTGRVNNSIFPRVTAMMGKTVSLNQPDPALDGKPVFQILTGSRTWRSLDLMRLAVPRFDDTVCWQQHQQVFSAIAIVGSNG